jgi:hypothetical protein
MLPFANYLPDSETIRKQGVRVVLAAIDTVMATGKVATFAVVAVWAGGEGGDTGVESGLALLRGGLESWRRHGSAGAV